MAATIPKPVKMSNKATDLLRFDPANETETIAEYRGRVPQCEELGEFAMAERRRTRQHRLNTSHLVSQ